MSDTIEQLSKLQQKVEKLIHLHRSLLHENQRLKTDNERIEEAVKLREREITELGEKLKVVRLARQVADAGTDQNTRDLKLKINEYIREIDRCLALINR
jgi:hypothetical protein